MAVAQAAHRDSAAVRRAGQQVPDQALGEEHVPDGDIRVEGTTPAVAATAAAATVTAVLQPPRLRTPRSLTPLLRAWRRLEGRSLRPPPPPSIQAAGHQRSNRPPLSLCLSSASCGRWPCVCDGRRRRHDFPTAVTAAASMASGGCTLVTSVPPPPPLSRPPLFYSVHSRGS